MSDRVLLAWYALHSPDAFATRCLDRPTTRYSLVQRMPLNGNLLRRFGSTVTVDCYVLCALPLAQSCFSGAGMLLS